MTSENRILREFVGTSDLDKYAFADERPDLKKAGVREPDNDVEKKLFKDIHDYVGKNIPLSNDACEKMRGYRRAGLYKDIFADIPNGVKSLYRGVTLGEDTIRRLVGEKRMRGKQSGHHEGRFVWLPKPGMTACSWSLSKVEAEMMLIMTDMPYEVVMRCDVNDLDSDAYVSLVDGLYKLKGVSHMHHEQEVLTFGPVSVTEIWWLAKS